MKKKKTFNEELYYKVLPFWSIADFENFIELLNLGNNVVSKKASNYWKMEKIFLEHSRFSFPHLKILTKLFKFYKVLMFKKFFFQSEKKNLLC